MRAQRRLWFGTFLLAAVTAGCAGGRGSSGFDISAENSAIARALTTRECVEVPGLTICPADQTVPTPTPTATAASTPPTPTATPPTPPGPTPTSTPNPFPGIDTGLENVTAVACTLPQPGNACEYNFTFTPHGFAPGTIFRTATRSSALGSLWQLGPDPAASGPGSPTLATVLALPQGAVQFAVLAFAAAPTVLPEQFAQLSQTGADFAFVTAVLSVQPVATFPPLGIAPQITYLGITRADDVVVPPTTFDAQFRPVYLRPSGSGMSLVIESRPGSGGFPVGTHAFAPAGGLPDLQLLVSQPLGNGSPAVCDDMGPTAGGVPATASLLFSDLPDVVNAINDLGCRVNDGTGQPLGRLGDSPCTHPNATSGEFAFVSPATTVQYCLPIAAAWAFAPGDTIVAARVRDTSGLLSTPQQIVVRVASPTPAPAHP
jgi:hypothetical protein